MPGVKVSDPKLRPNQIFGSETLPRPKFRIRSFVRNQSFGSEGIFANPRIIKKRGLGPNVRIWPFISSRQKRRQFIC